MTILKRGEILLIEDRDDVREGLTQLLELHGYMVTEVSDAPRGMDELSARPHGFALVLLDLVLGNAMDGADFRRCQLANPDLAAVPTVVMTASDVAAHDRVPLHAEGWLEKPFKFEALLEIVKRYVVPEGGGLIASDLP
jgi:CheY-like chemotaxis protein